MATTEPEFTPGQEVTWTGTEGLFSKRVRIVAPRRSFLAIFGETPDDAVTVYDIAVPGIIPAGQLHAVTARKD